MKKLIKISLNILLIIALIFPVFMEPLGVNAATKKEAQTIADLKEELAALKQEKIDNQNAKNQTQSQINSKKEALYAASKEQEEIIIKIEEAEAKIVESNQKIVDKTKETNELIRFLQIMDGESSYLEYISGAETTTDLVERVAIVEQITSYNEQVISELDALVKENEQLKIDLANRNSELDSLKEEYNSTIKSLGNKISALNEVNEDINSQIKNQNELIDFYKSVCNSETQLLSDCINLAYSARFIRPTTKGSISSSWGYRTHPITGKVQSFHNAIDIAGNSVGTPVYAAANGMVSAVSKKTSCGGNIVYIHHYVGGKYYTTQYAHLYTVNVKVGDKVTMLTEIGTVGGSKKYTPWDKCSTGAHLHFGISTGLYLGAGSSGYSSWSKFISNSVNPMKLLPSSSTKWNSRY